MKRTAYFFSDAHLGSNPTGVSVNREMRLIQWLHEIREEASHVVILGDLFEFWMEYRDYVGRHHFHLLRKLAELVDLGVEVHYIAGNHDFRLDSFFPGTLGVQVHRSLRLQLQGHNIFLLHGDGLAASDWKYRWASRILHSEWNVRLFRLLHPDWGMSLARLVGSTSRNANAHKAPAMIEYDETAKKILRREGCDALLHGHTHVQEIRTLPEGLHIHTGQWFEKLQYVSLQDGVFQLHQLESNSNNI